MMHLFLRIEDEVKEALERSAEDSRRSVNKEAEAILAKDLEARGYLKAKGGRRK
jgi:hypothetical protein